VKNQFCLIIFDANENFLTSLSNKVGQPATKILICVLGVIEFWFCLFYFILIMLNIDDGIVLRFILE